MSRQVVVLVRHGEAASAAEDSRRSLTVQGRARAGRIAAWLASCGLELEEVRHSDKRRAVETAGIVAAGLGLHGGLVAPADGLRPADDPGPVASYLEAERRSLALVGHLPHLPRLASVLLTGDPDRLRIALPDAAAIVLGRDHGGWLLLAVANPDWI